MKTTGARQADSGREQIEVAPEGRYRIIAALGEGGMANVYLAAARGPSGFNKLVVLKSLRPNLANDPEFLTMFLHEARLAARLNHPNVVQTYEVGEDAGRQVIVMEYLEGQPLSQVLARSKKEKPIPLPMQLRMLCDALAGLHHAHELKDFDGTRIDLVHRDVSPQNVFVTFEGQVKVLDFGIAKAAAIGAAPETQTGILKGKVRYMAPEQMAGERVDRRADVFAVGAMLWEALTGEKLWAGMADVAVMNRVMNGEIPSPRTVNPELSERLEQVCLKAMAANRDDRYETAQAFELDLDNALNELGTNVKQRDIGVVVSALFADTREEIKAIIETQMSKVSSLSSSDFQTVHPVTLSGFMRTPTGSLSDSHSQQTAGLRRDEDNTRKTAILLLLCGLSAGVAILLWVTLHKDDSRHERVAQLVAPMIAAKVSAPAPTATGSKTSQIEVQISVTPSQAKIYFDDVLLPSNPSTRSFAGDGSRHRIRAEAPGYVSGSLEVILDKSSFIPLALEKIHEQPGRPYRPPTTVAVTTPTPTPVGPAKPNCAQPYYVDDQGIKKIRAECM